MKPIHLAAAKGHIHTIKLLQEKGNTLSEKSSSGYTLMHHAALSGETEVVRYLCDNGVDVGESNRDLTAAVHLAALFGHNDLMKAILYKDLSQIDWCTINRKLFVVWRFF